LAGEPVRVQFHPSSVLLGVPA
jgi:hypothetical protein